jgi:hypothetical protein
MLHAVLYSPSQQAVHVETLAEYVQKERREVLLDKPTGGYRLMHIARSREEACEVASRWQRWRDERQRRELGCAKEGIKQFVMGDKTTRLRRDLLIALFPRPVQEDPQSRKKQSQNSRTRNR